MNLKFRLLLSSALFITCTEINAPHHPSLESTAYHRIELDTLEGYSINPTTNLEIHPIISQSGDSLVTGAPLSVRAVRYPLDKLPKAEKIKFTLKNGIGGLRKNVTPASSAKKFSSSKTNKKQRQLKSFEQDHDSTLLFTNNLGMLLKTGCPLSLTPRQVDRKTTPLRTASPPRSKDNASYNLQYLDVEQGLISSYIWCSLQDGKGNLWIGSDGAGVTRYDGRTFSNLTTKEGLSDDRVYCLLEDRIGRIWMGTYGGGLSVYDGSVFHQYTTKEGLTNDYILCIIQDAKGNIWWGTEGGGVTRYDGETFTHYTEKNGLSGNIVRTIFEDKKGVMWFGTDGHGICRFNGQFFEQVTTEDGLCSNYINAIEEDQNGKLWFATWGDGICSFDGEAYTHYSENEGLKDNYVLDILVDGDGDLWFSTNNQGVVKYDGTQFTYLTTNEGMSSNTVLSINQDEMGNMWFSTRGGGICKFNQLPLNHYTEQNGLSNNTILSILEDEQERLWLGTWGSGVDVLHDNKVFNVTQADGLCSDYIFSICKDHKGNIWFGGINGKVSKLDSTGFVNYDQSFGFNGSPIYSIFEDRQKQMWFGSMGGGLIKYDGEAFIRFDETNGLQSNEVICIWEDQQNNLWIGTNGAGLIKYDGQTFTSYTEKEGLMCNKISSIRDDHFGQLWIGTSGAGIVKFNGQTFTYYSTRNGLSDDYVFSVLRGPNDNIWVSTENGLNSIDINKQNPNSEVNSIRKFKTQDGLKALDFFSNSAYLDSKNRMWWGSGKGLTTLNLDAYRTSLESPKTILREIRVNDLSWWSDTLSRKTDLPLIQPFENYPMSMQLGHTESHLTFYFSGIDWSAPHHVKYSYYLKGIDDDWSPPSKEAKAEYRNLPPGKYEFQVKAIGVNSKWSAPTKYSFSIAPPWWNSVVAKIIYVLMLTSAFLLILRWRTKRLQLQKRVLQNKINKATKEIRTQKEQIEKAHHEITESINYAERIQRNFLATDEFLNLHLKEYMVYFNPKEAVSGDFYWGELLSDGRLALSCADSTGHGVHGAIMSMLNISCIERAIESGLTQANEIFNHARNTIIERLGRNNSDFYVKDGMDAVLMILDQEKTTLEYVAANNPIWIVRNKKLIELKPEKMPVGKHHNEEISFKGGYIDLFTDDVIYAMTDGFQDQFGGENGKKYKVRALRELVLQNAHLPLPEQKKVFSETFEEWKGDHEQIDDVCIMAIRI